MVEESSPVLPPAEESIEAEPDTALEPEPESGEPTPTSSSESRFVCDCKEWMRSACTGLPFYKEHESRLYCVLHYPGKEKSADFKAALDSKLNREDFDFRGVWFPDPPPFDGLTFNKPVDFTRANFHGSADFSRTIFIEVGIFAYATFESEVSFLFASFEKPTVFRHATFGGKTEFRLRVFRADADFSSAKFCALANFWKATFGAKTNFNSAIFNGEAWFQEATFKEADFTGATFNSESSFSSASFVGVTKFSYARFKDSLRFVAEEKQMFLGQSSLDLQHARMEKSDLVSFHSVTLRPHWFVNVDPRKFVFTNASWDWGAISIEGEVQSLLTRKGVSSPHHLLGIACRQLAENAESNNRYDEASRFRYLAMECRRQEQWPGFSFWKHFWNRAVAALTQLKQHRIVSLFTRNWLHWLYWVFSGYGERIWLAFLWLLAVWIVFASLYTQVGFQYLRNESETTTASLVIAAEPDTVGQPLPLKRAWIYSLSVMSLQKPEPKPLTGTAQTLVLLETILGPVQGALLALAIRRKFMR